MVWAALLIAQSLESSQGPAGGLLALIASLTAALQNPLEVRWTDKSLLSILACTGVYIMALAVVGAEHGRRREGAEHGSAAWASPPAGQRHVRPEGEQDPDPQCPPGAGYPQAPPLPECAGYRRQRRGQDPKLREAQHPGGQYQHVVTDPKQEVLTATGGWLKQNGYEIRVLNLVNLEQSDGYNPSAICGTRRTLSSW